MSSTTWVFPALVATVVVAGAAGFGATHIWDNRALEKVTAERDAARDCRQSGATLSPCPVVYRNTKIEWRDRIETVQTRDPRQAARIASLSSELAGARRTIRDLQRRPARPRLVAASGRQNGTRQYPYYSDERCPAGSVVVYDSGLSATAIARRHAGDPDVCYVLTNLHRVALTSPRR